jgi:predicted nucleic acid-binding protein
MVVLDTQYLISLKEEKGRDADDRPTPALDLAAELEAKGEPTRVPAAVVFELYISVRLGSKTIINQRAYERLLANKPVVDLDGHLARTAGMLFGEHKASDRRKDLDLGDAVVAAAGLTLNEPVVTNDGDFEDVDGLRVVLY